MFNRTIVLWMIAAFAWATPVAAQSAAPTTTAFDGTYVGVSRTLEGYQADPVTDPSSQTPAVASEFHKTRNCTPNGRPGPLTIAGGVPRYNGSTMYQATYEGSVNAQGVLLMHSPSGTEWTPRSTGAAP